ncbi:hypothetical protein PAMA_005404 [Pampus argenteus]
MYTRRSSRLRNASKQSPGPNEDVVRRQPTSKRRKTWQRKADDGPVNADEESGRDIIDLINGKHDAVFVEVADKGVDGSDEDCGSDSSIVSGPSMLQINRPEKLRSSQGLCSACRKLYQKAKKTRIKDKLLDNDPSSLSCDQWVLLKRWRPRRLPDARRNLLMHVQLAKKRLAKKGGKQSEQYLEDSSACSRPHTFLQRNLQCVKVSVKKGKNRRKRARDGCQGFRIAKQKRLHGNDAGHHTSVKCAADGALRPADGHSSGPDFIGCSSDEAESNVLELIPSSVTLVAAKPEDVSVKQKAAKKTVAFRDLLAQLRGNSSMIVRETR